MNLEDRHLYCFDCVQYRNRCVCEAGGVQQYRFRAHRLRFMQPVDEMPFMIGLSKIDICSDFARLIIKPTCDIIERVAAINVRLARSQQIEVGAVQNEYDRPVNQSTSPANYGSGCEPHISGTIWRAYKKARRNDPPQYDRYHLPHVEWRAKAFCIGRERCRSGARYRTRSREIVPRSTLAQVILADGDQLEIVHFVGGGQEWDMMHDGWSVAGRTFKSRLIVGTGKYKDFEQNAAALVASGAEIITVAVRRVNVSDPKAPMLTDYIDPKKYTYLPNTAGCFNADEAIRTLRLAREAGGWDLVKLEVLGEAKTLYPDMRETLEATEVLAKEGFLPMVYCVDDPIAAKQLEEAGAVAVMPLGAPIGSGLGIQNRVTIRLIVEGAKVPVLVDAGVGTASDAAVAMELGCDGVLMNTAIAEAKNPVAMATAMRLAVESGRLAYLAGRMGRRMYADPSSPLAGLI
jgi:thiazole synthase